MAALPAGQKAREMLRPRAGGTSISSSRTDSAGEVEQWDAVPRAWEDKRGGRGRAAHPCQAGGQRDGAGWGPGAQEDSAEEQTWSDPLVQGSVSSLHTARLRGGVGKADCSSSSKSWMLLQKYVMAGREQSPRGLI